MSVHSSPNPGAPASDLAAHDDTAVVDTTTPRAIVRAALGLALVADALFYDAGPTGFALPLWIIALALTTVSLAWSAGRSLSREVTLWLSAAVLFAVGAAWRDSEILRAFDFLAALTSLAFVAIALNDARSGLFAARLRDTVWAGLSLARTIAVGIVPVALRDAFPRETREQARPVIQPVLRALIVTVPLVVIFGALLLSADPVFASLTPRIDVERLVTHTLLIGFFAWVVGGWAAGALLGRPVWRAPDGLPFALGTFDVTVALGTLNVLFAAYVLVQFGSLFGGEAFVQARTGLSLSTYARSGFFELVWTALLVVPLLVGSRAALGPGSDVARRHTTLAMPMIALVIAMLLSAAGRLRLYVHYFGLTTDRFYPAVFMVWLAVVLVWLGVTALRGWGRPFVAGAVLSGLATLATLNVVNPDAIIARVNLGRAVARADSEQRPLDVAYLTQLSGDAIPWAVDAALASPREQPGTSERVAEDAARCAAATNLLDKWGPTSRRRIQLERPASWRNANVGERAGLRAVAAHLPSLWALKRAACAPAHR